MNTEKPDSLPRIYPTPGLSWIPARCDGHTFLIQKITTSSFYYDDDEGPFWKVFDDTKGYLDNYIVMEGPGGTIEGPKHLRGIMKLVFNYQTELKLLSLGDSLGWPLVDYPDFPVGFTPANFDNLLGLRNPTRFFWTGKKLPPLGDWTITDDDIESLKLRVSPLDGFTWTVEVVSKTKETVFSFEIEVPMDPGFEYDTEGFREEYSVDKRELVLAAIKDWFENEKMRLRSYFSARK